MALQIDTNMDNQQMSSANLSEGELLNNIQEQWITFCALGGLITDDEDHIGNTPNIKVMTITKFSEQIGVPRQTLYNWKRSIPNFGEKVRDRRKEVFTLSRETALWNMLYLIAMDGKGQPAVEACKLLLGHFSDLSLAPTKQSSTDDYSNNWVDLINSANKRHIIES